MEKVNIDDKYNTSSTLPLKGGEELVDLTIIILSYKSKEHLKALLPSVFASEGVCFDGVAPRHGAAANGGAPRRGATPPLADKLATTGESGSARYSAEVIVVDNGSNDGTLDWLKANSYKLKAIQNINNGFAAGNNLGIKKACGRYILLLNPDTKVEPDTFKTMLDFMESRPEVGISGCKLIKADGKLDLACRRRFPNPWNSFKRLFLQDNTYYNYSDIDENQSMEVDSVVGAFMLVRKLVIKKIGLLDETFFMYGEDLDWCWRCKEAGYKVWYLPKTSITHYKGESSRQIPFSALKWFHDAMWIFYQKHYAKNYAKKFGNFFGIIFSGLVFAVIYSRLLMLAIINLFKRNKAVSK
ncbi:MAG: glycosyltransferase family 2 protein [Patescibacteria group bacterium]|nr:glycosyltransferase family 2 protein [Patescibacteria group bacterium]